MDEVKSSATVTSSSRTNGTITFLDDSKAAVTFYSSGDNVCMRVTDPDQNKTASTAENISLIIASGAPADSETLTLAEEGVNAGTFFGCVATSASATAINDGVLSAQSNSQVTALYNDPLDATPNVTATAWIDPDGIVFDSSALTPVSGAAVHLMDKGGAPVKLPVGWANPFITSADGVFSFPSLPEGSYRVKVEAGRRHQFPADVPNGLLGGTLRVTDASKGAAFDLAANGRLSFDIPLTPTTPPDLVVDKKASKTSMELGDLVKYTITVENMTPAPVTGATVTDTLPKGIHYRPGTTLVDGLSVADPSFDGTRNATWSLGTLAAGQISTIEFTAAPGAG
ncbi:DUF11 domain-containing protein, partial [bacterium]